MEENKYSLKDIQLAVTKREAELYREFIEDLKALNKELLNKVSTAQAYPAGKGYWTWPQQTDIIGGGTYTVSADTSKIVQDWKVDHDGTMRYGSGSSSFTAADKEVYDDLVGKLRSSCSDVCSDCD